MTDDQIYDFWLLRDCTDAIVAGDMRAQFISAARALLAAPVAAADELTPCPLCKLAGDAIADERDASQSGRDEWKHLAESLMESIGQISNALGIPEEEQETASGNEEILDRIAELRAAPEAAEPVATEKERTLGTLFAVAMGHPIVLEILADCADCVDTENSAQHDSEVDGAYDGSAWITAARELREKAAAIRAEDPEIWPPVPTDSQAGMDAVEAASSPVWNAVMEVLTEHRLTGWEDEDGEAFPLVDHLTPKGSKSVEPGRRELAILCDEICAALSTTAGRAAE